MGAGIEQDETDPDTELFLLAAEAWIGLFNRARALAETKQADLRRTVADSAAARTGEQSISTQKRLKSTTFLLIGCSPVD